MGGGFGRQGARRSRWLQLLWGCASTPSHRPSLVLASPPHTPPGVPRRRCSLARSGCRRLPGSVGTRGGGAEGRAGLWRARAVRRGRGGQGGGWRETERAVYGGKLARFLSLGTFMRFEGRKWRHLETEALPSPQPASDRPGLWPLPREGALLCGETVLRLFDARRSQCVAFCATPMLFPVFCWFGVCVCV